MQLASLVFQGFPAPESEYLYAERAWHLFSREHNVAKIGPEFFGQKGNILLAFQ